MGDYGYGVDDLIAVGSLMLSPGDLKIRGISEGLARSLGSDPPQLIGTSLLDLVPLDHRASLDVLASEPLRETGEHFTLHLQSLLGDELSYNASFLNLSVNDQTLIAVSLVETEVVRRKELEQKRLEAILSATSNAIVSKNLKGIVTHWNQGAERMFGYKAEEMIGASIQRIIPPDRMNEEELILGRCAEGKTISIWETVRRKKNGDSIEISLTCTPILNSSGQVIGITKIAQDIGVQTRQQKELSRMSRLYSALSQVNQAIVWSSSQEDLLVRVCRVLVEHGGFVVAWISWFNSENQSLEPVAVFGDENDYIKNVRIKIDDRPEGLGPVGRSFTEERPVISNDYWRDPTAAPWHGEARRRGIRSCGVFPIRLQGRVVATLQVYASEIDFFMDKEVALLTEAATDISFALDTFALQAAHDAAEKAAEAERIFSATMIESMPGVVYFYDLDYNFLRWNENFSTVTGYSSEEIQMMTPLDFFSEEDRPGLEERIKEVFEKGQSWIETRFRCKDGTLIEYHFTGRRVEYQGKPCLIGMGVDISEMAATTNALIQSERRFRSTLESILEACQLLDFDWRYVFLNEAASLHNRRPNSELLGKTLFEAWPGIEQSHVYGLMKKAMEERVSCHDETVFRFPDGHTGTFEVMAQPVPEGLFLLSIDISERKRAEEALRELNESLEHKILERTDELREALIRAESADKIKTAFLATMSHELRTPLNSIIGFTGILLQELAGPLNPEQTKQLKMVQTSARHLLDLITDVLDISKIEAGQLEIRREEFDLAASFNRVCDSITPLVNRKGLKFKSEVPSHVPTMIGDRVRLEQVLLNLLSNAVKFCEVGEVSIALEIREQAKLRDFYRPVRAAAIIVKDTGVGISPEHINQLFQPFKQLDSGLARQHEGTGLGLAICNRLVGLMKGEISVESQPNLGSIFTVIIPLEGGDNG